MNETTPTPQDIDLRLSEIDPFPQPSTFPEGWNMESILNPNPVKARASQPLPLWHESFHEPRTYPSGWVYWA
jgi:hypothetical protein